MRVLETKSLVAPGMVKRKQRIRKLERNECGDSSDEAGQGGALCQHVNKAVNLSLVRKAIKQHGVTGKCMQCEKESEKDGDKVASPEADPDGDHANEEVVWLCLQCGNQGCGRMSENQHALKHYETPRSYCHALVLNLSNWDIWCYDCDDEIPYDCSKKLMECVDFVRKNSGVPAAQIEPGKRSGSYKKREEETAAADHVTSSQDQQLQNKVKPIVMQPPAIPGLPKVKGLSNLGNTCFFNAVMQSLSQTPILEVVLTEKIKKNLSVQLCARYRYAVEEAEEGACASSDEDKPKIDIEPLSITLAEGGTLSNSVLSFLRDMSASSKSTLHVVSPSALFGQVCKKSPRFKGFQQQDSHELLRCLLDGMKAEEVKRSQHAILNSFKLHEGKGKPKVDDDTKQKIKAYGHQVKHTFVDSIFGGIFISTVMCEECHVPSQIFEPFLDVSLPVTEEKTIRPNHGRKKDSAARPNEPSDKADKSDKSDKLDDIFCAGINQQSRPLSKKEKRKAKKDAQKKEKAAGRKGDGSEESGDNEEQNKDKGSGTESLKDNWDDEPETENNPLNNPNTGTNTAPNNDPNTEPNSEPQDSPPECTSPEGLDDEERLADHMADGLSLDQVAEQTVNQRSGEEDTDSNKVNVSGSDQHLSDSDADIEDNLEPSLSYQEGFDDTSLGLDSPPSPSRGHNNSLEKFADDGTSKESLNIAQNTDGIDNKDLVTKQDKDATRTNAKESVGSNSSGSNAALNKMDSQDCEEIKHILDKNKPNVVSFDDDTNFQSLSDKLKKVKLENESPTNTKPENDTYYNNKSPTHDDDITPTKKDEADINKTNILKSIQNLSSSRPNTPQSPTRLSRSSSIKSSSKSRQKQLQIEARLAATQTLVPRYQAESHECSVMSCLNQFTSAELLTGNNKFGCEVCTRRKYANAGKDVKRETVYTNASKQVLLFTPPAVLTLHLKRFQQVGFSLRKVSRHVNFPLLLDLAPYCSALAQGVKSGQEKVLYSLYGIVEHSGRLSGGHYTAYVKVRPHSTQHIQQFLQHCDLKSIQLERILARSRDTMTRDTITRDTAPDSSVTPSGAHDGSTEATSGAAGNESAAILENGDGGGVNSGATVPVGKWYYISDSRVHETSEAKALQCQAYLLFYERVL